MDTCGAEGSAHLSDTALAMYPALVVIPNPNHPKLHVVIKLDCDPVQGHPVKGRKPNMEIVAGHVDAVYQLVRGPRIR